MFFPRFLFLSPVFQNADYLLKALCEDRMRNYIVQKQ